MLPTVDIVIPARDEQQHLAACLEAILVQDYPAHLINTFVVDNSDDDLTLAVARKFDVHAVKSKIANIANARNIGIKLGSGELIALLDAHCIAGTSWIRNLVATFDEPKIGGCQGRIIYRHDSFLVRLLTAGLFDDSAEYEMHGLVSGENSAYPAIGTGNAMFRRGLIESVGYFSTDLLSCEDIDLSWKIVLLGYHFAFASDAIVTHVSPHSLSSYARKIFNHGLAEVKLIHKYQLKKKAVAEKSAPMQWRLPTALRLLYKAGHYSESLRMKQDDSLPKLYQYAPIDGSLRPPFVWTDGSRLKVSGNVVYWFNRQGQSTCVDFVQNSRFVLDGSGDFFFRRLCEGCGRIVIIEQAVAKYGQSAQTIAEDLDSFVSHLLAESILEPVRNCSNDL